jgi:hypothetical protein
MDAKIADGEDMLKDNVRPSRRSRWLRSMALVVIALCWLPASCRRDTVWFGADYAASGKILKLASEEPFCGCIYLQNVSPQPIYLRSNVLLEENHWRPVARGGIVLAPGGKLRERFDWAGSNAEDVFQLDAWTADGKPLHIRDVVRMNDYGWPFQPCEAMECKRGPLFMNTGAVHQR